MSQRDLEIKSGIPKSRISRYENGHLLPSLTGLRKLATSLGLPYSDLLEPAVDANATFLMELRKRGVVIGSVRDAEKLAALIAPDIAKWSAKNGSKGATRSRASS